MNVSEVKTNQISSIVGTVAFFARSSAPTGWLKCNGAAISRTDYADLFDSIGTTYGTGNGSTTFNLPDLRGEFVRCLDDGRGVDNGRPLTSSSVAHIQDWAIQNFSGAFNTATSYSDQVSSSGITYRSSNYGVEAHYQRLPERSASRVYIEASRQINTSTETRPRNVPLLSCIKY